MVADGFVSKLCEMLLTYAKEEAAKILGVPDEIKKLHRRLKRIQVVLADAENRRFENHRHQPLAERAARIQDEWLRFPENYLISDDLFINSCIAEGFVTSEDITPLEDVAKGYWKELVQRNLLQPDPTWYDESACRMHDLLRSLAQHIARDECFIGDARAFENKMIMSSSSSSLIKLRRLSVVDGKLETISDLMMKQTSLRTPSFCHTPLIHDLPEDLFRKLRNLRVPNLHETAINNLPTSMGDLVHLRRLDLSETPIRQIPGSIGNLRNLQFLILQDCKYLRSLPSSVMGLINLRVLDCRDTPLDGMPVGIGRLQLLHSIKGLVVNGSKGGRSRVGDGRKQEHRRHQRGRLCTLEELKSLSQLKYLSIYKLERVSNSAEARAAALEAKPHLVFLEMYCTLRSSSSDVQQPRAKDYEVFFTKKKKLITSVKKS
ncbi:hypothetical protein COCNU_01G000760 [Cocos nucifera]|uniref:Uncharacterized protein n=1 Tax=Cocos nucifera TaxID=13894 RepID=A0A8K0MTJ7_COCNU|nr:hypothetical protein COCNU_01G000760 [Cocos nucifera]